MATITESLSRDYVIPDDVLIEILLRLPLLSLQLFKSVSKHWLSLINSPYFVSRLQKPRIDTPCGLFIQKHKSEYYDFVTLGPKVTSFPLRATITEAGSCFLILQSCNGLLLCTNYVSSVRYYYVYNPFTNLFKNIPFPRSHWSTDMILAFDPTKSPYYKVVITEKLSKRTSQIQIYSSETGKWSVCGPRFPKHRFGGFLDGIYWNKAIHWVNDNENLHYKFDIVDHPMITNIPSPALHKKARLKHIKLFESRGSLLLLKKENSFRYHVFEMREEASNWSVKYIVNDLINIVPYYKMYTRFLCIVLGESREDDSYMVIESHNKIVRYNFVSKTVSALCNSVRYYSSYHCSPFIASLADV